MRSKLYSYLAILAVCIGCGKSQSAKEAVSVKGSDTMVQLAQRWAENYMKADSSVRITVNGGGSGTGFSALINGTIDLCTASRPIKDAEKDQLQKKFGSMPVEFKVAKDGVTIYLNKNNPVNELSMEQLKGIYTGKITNWKELGGSDAPIVVYGRENSSGTYAFFKEHILENADYANSIQTLPGTAAVVNAVQRDINGIGYGGAGYAKELKEALVKKTAADQAYAPTKENIDNDAYPLSRYLFIYARKAPEGKAKQFIDWIKGPEGQAIVAKEGYFPINSPAM